MAYVHKRPEYRVVFFRVKRIVTFIWANQPNLPLARALADELSTTLSGEWAVQILDTHNKVDSFYSVVYEVRGACI